MKKIFILTGEPSGDKLAAKVISKLKSKNNQIEYLALGGENLKAIGITSIFNLDEVTFLGFTRVILNIFKIKRKISETSKKIIEFNPDILFSVDSPDFTLRVAKLVKKKSPKIKTVHFVAPQVWVWRENRVKKIKNFIDHIFLLFKFEKKYWVEGGVSCEFVGHPLLEKNTKDKIDLNQIIGINKAVISIFPGSRKSEIKALMPIIINFIKLMNVKYNDFLYVFHTSFNLKEDIQDYFKNVDFKNFEIISDDKIKSHILKKSIFSVTKSGTISLEVCNEKVPQVVIYKMNFINFFIIKMLVKIKYANIINIAAKKMIIPELLQSNCNSKQIFKTVSTFLEDPKKIEEQIKNIDIILDTFKTKNLPTEIAANSINEKLL